MICRKLLFLKPSVLLLLLLSLALSVSLSMASYASDNESLEIVQDEQTETVEPISQANDQEIMAADQQLETLEQDQESVQHEQSTEINPNSQEIGQTFDQYEPYSEYIPETIYSDTDSEILLTLKSIEYQLKIIAGGMVLAVISLFIWFTILKPIKNFTRV